MRRSRTSHFGPESQPGGYGAIVNPTLASVLLSWDFDPPIILAVLVAVTLYALGCARFRRRNGRLPVSRWRVVAFGGGMLAVVLALLSPIHTFDSLLFSVHMIEHLLIILVAAPLLLLGGPQLPMLWGLPDTERRGFALLFLVPRSPAHRLFSYLTQPLVCTALLVSTVAAWHLPPFYDAAQGQSVVHALEHATFFFAALLYWWMIIQPNGSRRGTANGLAIVALVPPVVEGVVIGALLTFASGPIYATYRNAPRLFDVSALTDQQVAGLIMWIPPGFVYLGTLFALLTRWLHDEERRQDALAAMQRVESGHALGQTSGIRHIS